MSRNLTFRPYRRRFRTALRTARGTWREREGFLLRVEEGGRVGYGEVAPIPEFGSETLGQARACLEALASDPLRGVPVDRPCCAFALSCATAPARAPRRDYELAALLPAGEAAGEVLAAKARAGYDVFKWKIGLSAPETELACFEGLLARAPEGARFRLDANGGLSEGEARRWMEGLRRWPGAVEFIEQPLAPGQETRMAELASETGVAVALDESLNGPGGADWLVPGAWTGPLVIKAPLMGDREALLRRLRPVAPQLVFSSVFETAVGLANSLALADELATVSRAVGFDTIAAFDDSLNPLPPGPGLGAAQRGEIDFDLLWTRLRPST